MEKTENEAKRDWFIDMINWSAVMKPHW